MRNQFPRIAIAHSAIRSGAGRPWTRVRRRRTLVLAPRKPRARVLPMQVAAAMASKLDRKNVMAMMGGLKACLAALRTGTGHLNDVLEFEYATISASLIERKGVVRGLAHTIADAEAAITSMRRRADNETSRVGPLFGHEITALDALIRIHHFQLEQLSQGEYEGVLRSLAGRLGGKIQAAVEEIDKRRA